MKKIIKALLTLILLLSFVIGNSQVKNDLILTKSNDIIEAKVTLIGDTRIQYILPGEERINEMSVEKLVKVKFANGKEQVFKVELDKKTVKKEEDVYTYPVLDKDLVAIIPFDFYEENSGRSLGKKGLEVQQYIERKLSNQTQLKVMNRRTTNSRLRKAKVDYTRLEQYTIEELSKILGVGTIITGDVKFTFEEDFFIDYYDYEPSDVYVEETVSIDRDGRVEGYTDIYEVSSGSEWYFDIESYESYQTRTTMQIYENNVKVYDNERSPLFQWGTANDWEGNIDWLLLKSKYKIPR